MPYCLITYLIVCITILQKSLRMEFCLFVLLWNIVDLQLQLHTISIRLILLIPNAYFVHVRITKTMEKWLAITEFRLSGCAINFRNIMKTLAGGMAQTVWPSVISDWNKERKGKRNLQQ